MQNNPLASGLLWDWSRRMETRPTVFRHTAYKHPPLTHPHSLEATSPHKCASKRSGREKGGLQDHKPCTHGGWRRRQESSVDKHMESTKAPWLTSSRRDTQKWLDHSFCSRLWVLTHTNLKYWCNLNPVNYKEETGPWEALSNHIKGRGEGDTRWKAVATTSFLFYLFCP